MSRSSAAMMGKRLLSMSFHISRSCIALPELRLSTFSCTRIAGAGSVASVPSSFHAAFTVPLTAVDWPRTGCNVELASKLSREAPLSTAYGLHCAESGIAEQIALQAVDKMLRLAFAPRTEVAQRIDGRAGQLAKKRFASRHFAQRIVARDVVFHAIELARTEVHH